MAPFPEADDMTIKRLYVALKHNDMQLLQLGAHKLHEKYHTGHKFEYLDALREILPYIEEQNIPNDIKDLLTRTINDILNGENPTAQSAPVEKTAPVQEEYREPEQLSLVQNFPEENIEQNETQIEEMKEEIPAPEAQKEEPSPLDIIYSEQNTMASSEIFNIPAYENTPKPEAEESYNSHSEGEFSEQTNNEAIPEVVENKEEVNEEIYVEEKPYEEQENSSTQQYEYNEEQQKQEEPAYEEHHEEYREEQPQQYEEQTPEPSYKEEHVVILEEKESTLENVAVFYDDKATVTDYMQNKLYRSELDSLILGKETNPEKNASINKKLVDVLCEEINEILKMLNTIKGDVYFITTSKSENIIKTFIGNGIEFKLPLVNDNYVSENATTLLPLYGLSNLFVCPKCGKKEYFGGFHNAVLTLQCKECASVMYPDLYEANNYDTNANPYYWIKAINGMAKSDTWILINPPLENNKGLSAELIKSAFEVAKPKKVYILSKETTKKEYYKQMFKEICPSCDVKSDYLTQDTLCEDFISNEMSTLKVNI